MIDTRTLEVTVLPDKTKLRLARICPLCGKRHSMIVDAAAYSAGLKAYETQHLLVQQAWPTFSPDEREMIMSGTCNDCWNSLSFF